MTTDHSLPDPTEIALADACRAGDRQAQFALWRRYKDRMFGVCMRFAASREEAEDWLQEAFVRVFHSIGEYRGTGSLEGWVRRITVRTALQQLQKLRLSTETLNERQWADALQAVETIESEEDEPGRLVTLLQGLPPGFRAVLNLYVVEERSHEEIARAMGISVGTSKSQLHRAKALLRQLLDKTLLLL